MASLAASKDAAASSSEEHAVSPTHQHSLSLHPEMLLDRVIIFTSLSTSGVRWNTKATPSLHTASYCQHSWVKQHRFQMLTSLSDRFTKLHFCHYAPQHPLHQIKFKFRLVCIAILKLSISYLKHLNTIKTSLQVHLIILLLTTR